MTGKMISFIGIGNMGWPMASNLVRAGYQVTVYDADQELTGRFCSEHDNAIQAQTLEQLGSKAEIVITMLPNGHIVRQVMLEESGGLARHMTPGTLVIDMSSSDPIGTRELGNSLRESGIQFVDAPVSGGVPGARNGTLAIMIGCDDKTVLERARPILSVLGKRLFETGPLGSGHAMKSLNNYAAAMGFAAVSETLIIGAKFGLDPATIIDVLNASTGRNFTSESTIMPEVVKRAFSSGFALALLAKDVKIAADLAGGLGLDMPFAQLISKDFLDASKKLGPNRDFTETFLFWESRALGDKT